MQTVDDKNLKTSNFEKDWRGTNENQPTFDSARLNQSPKYDPLSRATTRQNIATEVQSDSYSLAF